MSNNDKSTLNNQKKRKADSSSQIAASNKKSQSSSSPIQNTRVRLTDFECRRMTSLLKEAYADFFNSLLAQLRSNENLLDSEAKVSNRSIQREENSDEDSDKDSFITEDENEDRDQDEDSLLSIQLDNLNNIEEEQWDENSKNSLPISRVLKKIKLSKNNNKPLLPKPKPSPKKIVVATSSSNNYKRDDKSPPPPRRDHPNRERKQPKK
jgi:hypothetical protein